MSTDIAVRQTGSSLAISGEQDGFTEKQVAALRQLGVEEATQGDLDVYFYQCQRTGLDPFAKQIYLIGRKSRGQMKYTIQTGIDGYRLIARRAVDRTKESLGYEDTRWCGRDGKWTDVWLSDQPPAAARVVVLRNGQRFPATALWSEYVQTKYDGNVSDMWSRMGANQLAKCAEALALRKAFPQDLSGIYTDEEMQQAERVGQPDAQPQRAVQATPEPNPIGDAKARAWVALSTMYPEWTNDEKLVELDTVLAERNVTRETASVEDLDWAAQGWLDEMNQAPAPMAGDKDE